MIKGDDGFFEILVVGTMCYNESYGLGKDGIRRENTGRYEYQGVRGILGGARVPQSVLEKTGFAGENAVLKRFLKRSFKNLQKPFNSSFKRFFATEK